MATKYLAVLVVLAAPSPAKAGSCVAGFDDAAFGKNSVSFGGGGTTDSYDSTLGFAASHVSSGGNIGTDGTACGAVTLSGAPTTIGGNIAYGAGGTACAVSGSPPASINGSSAPLPANVALPSVTIPTVGSVFGNQSGSPHSTLALAPNNTYGNVSMSGGANLQLSSGTYVFSTLSLSGGSTLTVASAPIEIYIKCPAGGSGVSISSANAIVNASLKATDLVFFVGAACSDVNISGGSTSSYALYAPDSDVSLTGGSTLYGAVVGKTVKDSGGTAIHYDRALGTYAGGGFACLGNEVSRASPVAATITASGTPYTAVVQGTFVEPSGTAAALTTHASVASWTFPFITGHMRARVASSITTTASTFASGTLLFDANGKMPAPSYGGCSLPAHGACRYVFTNTATGFHPAQVVLSDATSASVGALIAPSLASADDQTVVHTILNGTLGGVDRSTVAVIQASTYAGNTTRPTIAYFGGTDGMLHAVCASTGGTTASQASVCPSLGTELWAFLPRVELPLVRSNSQRIDGSPHVIDAFGDFSTTPGLGTRGWHTILTLQTGYSVAGTTTGAAYAIDVTDPASPVLLWEYATPSAPAALDFGTGLVSALGPVVSHGGLVNEAVLETNNGGTGGAGVVTTALQLETGAKLWQFGALYPAAAGVPATGLPGGAVGVDLAGNGYVTDIVFGDLYGELWRLSAGDGSNPLGTTPLFSFTFNAASDKHPIGALPAIYSDGNREYVAFTSGGYADAFDTSWSKGTQYLAAVKLQATAFPLHETTGACGTCDLRILQPLAAGDNGFAQALIVGTQLFVTSDSTDVNASTYGTTGVATGHVLAISGLNAAPTATTAIVYSGASSLAASGTALYGSASDKQQQLATSSAGTTGTSVAIEGTPRLSRNVWMKTQ